MMRPRPSRHAAAPVLRTERLTLRSHREDDLSAAAAMWADAAVVRFIGGKPFGEQQANGASIRVARKCGYREHARARCAGAATILFAREKGLALKPS